MPVEVRDALGVAGWFESSESPLRVQRVAEVGAMTVS
jgi:hypothetical protein